MTRSSSFVSCSLRMQRGNMVKLTSTTVENRSNLLLPAHHILKGTQMIAGSWSCAETDRRIWLHTLSTLSSCLLFVSTWGVSTRWLISGINESFGGRAFSSSSLPKHGLESSSSLCSLYWPKPLFPILNFFPCDWLDCHVSNCVLLACK